MRQTKTLRFKLTSSYINRHSGALALLPRYFLLGADLISKLQRRNRVLISAVRLSRRVPDRILK